MSATEDGAKKMCSECGGELYQDEPNPCLCCTGVCTECNPRSPSPAVVLPSPPHAERVRTLEAALRRARNAIAGDTGNGDVRVSTAPGYEWLERAHLIAEIDRAFAPAPAAETPAPTGPAHTCILTASGITTPPPCPGCQAAMLMQRWDGALKEMAKTDPAPVASAEQNRISELERQLRRRARKHQKVQNRTGAALTLALAEANRLRWQLAQAQSQRDLFIDAFNNCERMRAQRDEARKQLSASESLKHAAIDGNEAMMKSLLKSEAGAAAMREALELAKPHVKMSPLHTSGRDFREETERRYALIEAALATDAGAAILQEVAQLRNALSDATNRAALAETDAAKLMAERDAAVQREEAMRESLKAALALPTPYLHADGHRYWHTQPHDRPCRGCDLEAALATAANAPAGEGDRFPCSCERNKRNDEVMQWDPACKLHGVDNE